MELGDLRSRLVNAKAANAASKKTSRTSRTLREFKTSTAREDARRPLATSLREAALRPGHTSLSVPLSLCVKNKKERKHQMKIDWKGLLKAMLKAALPFLLGGAIGVTASGCSSLQTPSTKTQTSAIYAFGLPAIVVTHDATQTADYSGGDTNETMQSNK